MSEKDRTRESMLKILKAEGLDAVAASGGTEPLAELERND
jgi:hypothetical protein